MDCQCNNKLGQFKVKIILKRVDYDRNFFIEQAVRDLPLQVNSTTGADFSDSLSIIFTRTTSLVRLAAMYTESCLRGVRSEILTWSCWDSTGEVREIEAHPSGQNCD